MIPLYLNKDCKSYFSSKVYAVKGSKVYIIGDHDNVVTVVSEDGVKFGIKKEYLSNDFIEKEKIIIESKSNKNGKKKNR